MSILTIAQLKTEIRSFFGGRTDLDDRLDSVINMAQYRVARLKDFDELRALATIPTAITASAAADKIISLIQLGNYRKIYSIRLYATNAQSRKLIKMNPKKWDALVPEAEYYSRGTPTHYVIWGRTQMEVSRVPDIVYQMYFRYSRWPTIITGATPEANSIDLALDDVIVHLAASYIAMSTGNMEKSNNLYTIYSTLVREALDEEVEDFDTHIAAAGTELAGAGSRGYNDPFVRSTEEI